MEAVEGIEEDNIVDSLSSWALEEGLWDGRPISRGEASELQRKIQERLLSILKTEEVTATHSQQMAMHLAHIGSQFKNRNIHWLRLPSDRMALGIGRSCKRFYADHKKEIIIGLVVIAVVTTVVVIAVYSGGTAAGGAGAAGTKLVNDLANKNAPPPQIPSKPPQTEEVLERVREELAENDIRWGYEEDQKLAEWYQEIYEEELAIAKKNGPPTPAFFEFSRPFQIAGVSSNAMQTCWINGINNTLEESQASAAYLQQLSGGREITGIYNKSQGVGGAIDLAEAIFVNHHGASPITADLLIKTWTDFHEKNIDNPNAKLQQFCHSQGTIHTKNALLQCPKEIRDRVIIEAIAPAAIIPDDLCFQAHNYVSEKDWIYIGDPALRPMAPQPDMPEEIFIEQAKRLRNSIIVLPAHPDSTDSKDHYFQSPTYKPPVEKALANYENHQGQYAPDERGK